MNQSLSPDNTGGIRHRFDYMTHYCIRCGIPMVSVVEHNSVECMATDNVIAISHIISAKRLGELTGTVKGGPGYS